MNGKWRWLTSTVVIVLVALTLLSLFKASAEQRRSATAPSAPTALDAFAFSPPKRLVRPDIPASPGVTLLDQDIEPEIKADIFGNIYVTAINGVPGGVDLWKSIDKGANFVYLGHPDGAQDRCGAPPLPTCVGGVGGGDDSIDVSSGGYLYVSSLSLASVTVSTSMDGGTGGVEPGQAWVVNPATTGIPVEDRQWLVAYGPQTVYMTFRQAPGTGRLLFTKSVDAGKTFSAPQLLTTADSTQGNLVVDPYNGNLYTTFIPTANKNRIDLLKSLDGGTTWTTSTAYTGPAGSNPGHKFTIMAVDRGGNVHLVFSRSDADGKNCHVFLTTSVNQAVSWSTPVQVDSGPANNTAVMPWVVAGSPGVVDITWLGSSGVSADAAPFDWKLFFAQTRNALSAAPTFDQTQITTNPMHDKTICFNGTGCASGTRELAEYYAMTIDPDGFALISYPDTVHECAGSNCVARTWFTKQTGGTSAYAPPAGPAPATFAPNIAVGSPGAEPSIWVDSFNCIYVTAPGNPWLWKSENNGASFLAPVNPVADELTLTGGDEDVISLPKADGTRPDQLYFTDLGLSSDHIRKSNDGAKTWVKPGPGGAAGDVAISSDRQWLAGDRGAPTAADQVIYHWEHELASEAMRISSLVNDTAWQSTSGMTEPELFDPVTSTLPNTNPGPIFVNKTTHRGFALFNGSVVRNNANDPPFGKLLNVWSTNFAPPLNAASPVTDVKNVAVFKGVIDSPTTAPAGTTTYGANNANIFPAGDIDSAGNIYVAWSVNNARTNEFSIWFASSRDQGKTFYGPFPVSTGPLNADETSVFPWVAAGDDGRVSIVWYQSSTVGDPNAMPAAAEWNVMFAQSLNANSREPVFTVSKASDHVMHKGSISTGGLIGSSDRSLLDFFEVAIGPDGLSNIIYADNGQTATHAEYARQNGGPLMKATPSSPVCVDPSASPTPTATASPSPTATASASPTATATATATASPTPTGTPGPTVTPGPTATPTATASATASPTPTETPGPTASPTPTGTPGPTATPTPSPANVQLLNISGRVFAQTGDRIGIGGFIISGSANKRVIVRAIGPSMTTGGTPVAGRMENPVLELHAGDGHTIRSNDNWRESQEQEIEQSGLAPSDDREAAIIGTLPPGNYTALIAGANNSTGIGLIEIYDIQQSSPSELGNLAVRADVKTDDNVLIDGLILRGGTPKRILFRAIGPSLQSPPNTLQDPVLELHDGNGTLLQENNDWKEAPNAAEIEATGLAPTHNRESAILLTLPPANYTSIVRGANGLTGIAVSEAYKLNN